MNGFILAGALTFGQPVYEVLPDNDAPRYALKAVYQQSGLNKIVSRWEKKHLKFDRHPELVYIGVVGRIATEKRITWRWEF